MSISSAHYGPMPSQTPFWAARGKHEDELRIKPRWQLKHPKDFEHKYQSRVKWSELLDEFGRSDTPSMADIVADLRDELPAE